jgi:hypothetical protein
MGIAGTVRTTLSYGYTTHSSILLLPYCHRRDVYLRSIPIRHAGSVPRQNDAGIQDRTFGLRISTPLFVTIIAQTNSPHPVPRTPCPISHGGCARTRNGRLLGADSSSLIVLQWKEVLCVHVLFAGAQRDPGACKCTL